MNKILFVCNLFSPANHISAVRPTKLAKYLSKKSDLKITIIAQEESKLGYRDSLLKTDINSKNINIIWVKCGPICNLCKQIINQYSKLRRLSDSQDNQSIKYRKNPSSLFKMNEMICSIIKECRGTFFYLLNRIIERDKAATTIRLFKKLDMDFDIVVTFGPNYSDYVGRYIKSLRRQKIKWIADFRDPFINDFTPKVFYPFAKNYGKHIIKKANGVIAVTQGYLDSLLINKEQNSLILSNGFDVEDIKGLSRTKFKNDKKIIFSCVGALYKGKRKIDPLLRCLKELEFEGKINLENVMIYYAGNSEKEILLSIRMYNFQPYFYSYGSLTRKESLELQLSSDFLVLPSWNDFHGQDIMPGKLLEFMMIERPVISIISGLESNSLVNRIISELNLGFSYEEASEPKAYYDLKNYIHCAFDEWESTGQISFNPNKHSMKRYEYSTIAEQFYKYIYSI